MLNNEELYCEAGIRWVEIMIQISTQREKVRGYRFTYAPRLLWHFTARFEPIGL